MDEEGEFCGVVEPGRVYSFAEARNLLPSVSLGKRVSLETLHSWRLRGHFEAIPRQVGKRTYWFVAGTELLKLVARRPPRAGATGLRIRQLRERMEQLRRSKK